MNVIGTRPDGWWRDRAGAARRLIGTLQEYSRRHGDRIAVVLDGRPLPDFPEGAHDGVLVAYARRGGRDAADDRIVEEVERDHDPSSLVVVTSDHGLQVRVQRIGCAHRGRVAVAQRSGIGKSVTPSSRWTRNVLSAIDTRWYCPTVNTRSSSCGSS